MAFPVEAFNQEQARMGSQPQINIRCICLFSRTVNVSDGLCTTLIFPIYFAQVQGILLPIIKNYKIAPLVRTCAAFVLLELKPTFPVLMTLANAMLHEPSIQVENFVFVYLSTIADSRSPEFLVM